MAKYQFLAGVDIKVGGDTSTIVSKVNAFFAIEAVSLAVIALQFFGCLMVIWKLGGPAIGAVMSRNWKSVALDTGGFLFALFLILKFQLVLTGFFYLVDLFGSK